MKETNNFTNLTRLSSFLLLDMLLLIDMTWNTHLSAKNTERKRYILGDRELDKRRVDRQNTQILNDARPNRVQTYAEGSAWSVAVAFLSWTSPSETPEAQHGCTIAFTLQQWHVEFSGGSSFSTNWAGLFFLLLRFFPFFFLFSLFFFFLERDCLLYAICDTWLCVWSVTSSTRVLRSPLGRSWMSIGLAGDGVFCCDHFVWSCRIVPSGWVCRTSHICVHALGICQYLRGSIRTSCNCRLASLASLCQRHVRPQLWLVLPVAGRRVPSWLRRYGECPRQRPGLRVRLLSPGVFLNGDMFCSNYQLLDEAGVYFQYVRELAFCGKNMTSWDEFVDGLVLRLSSAVEIVPGQVWVYLRLNVALEFVQDDLEFELWACRLALSTSIHCKCPFHDCRSTRVNT